MLSQHSRLEISCTFFFALDHSRSAGYSLQQHQIPGEVQTRLPSRYICSSYAVPHAATRRLRQQPACCTPSCLSHEGLIDEIASIPLGHHGDINGHCQPIPFNTVLEFCHKEFSTLKENRLSRGDGISGWWQQSTSAHAVSSESPWVCTITALSLTRYTLWRAPPVYWKSNTLMVFTFNSFPLHGEWILKILN